MPCHGRDGRSGQGYGGYIQPRSGPQKNFGMRDYIAKQGYADIKALVAFSGELEVDGQTRTEAAVNGIAASLRDAIGRKRHLSLER